jgi:hypothetical protein
MEEILLSLFQPCSNLIILLRLLKREVTQARSMSE